MLLQVFKCIKDHCSALKKIVSDVQKCLNPEQQPNQPFLVFLNEEHKVSRHRAGNHSNNWGENGSGERSGLLPKSYLIYPHSLAESRSGLPLRRPSQSFPYHPAKKKCPFPETVQLKAVGNSTHIADKFT